MISPGLVDDGTVAWTHPVTIETSKPETLSLRGSDRTHSTNHDDDLFRWNLGILEDDEAVKAGISAWKKLRLAGNCTTSKYVQEPSLLSSSTMDHARQADPKATTRDPSSNEQDFTTHGTQGDLRCPFASEKLRRRQGTTPASSGQIHQIRPDALPTPPGLKGFPAHDPIAAEFHATAVTSPPPSVAGSASKCPIRFLDQHSPEEVAKYFENHKHEIPRSHEICVKRYQRNEEGIRQLDAKYGNLVSMIQGLGVKHQPMLVTREDEDETSLIVEQGSMEKVARWATTCSENVDDVEELAQNDNSETRTSKFGRTLKEIRVGESPSRPWGIQVPYREGLAESNHSEQRVEAEAVPSVERIQVFGGQPSESYLVSETKPSKCPFGHAQAESESQVGSLKQTLRFQDGVASWASEKQSVLAQESSPKVKVDTVNRREQPRMVFTGPVFIGYTAEQVANLLQTHHQS